MLTPSRIARGSNHRRSLALALAIAALPALAAAQGTPHFQGRQYAAGVQPTQVELADLDGDGLPEAITLGGAVGNVAVGRGLGLLGFAAPTSYGSGSSWSMALADFNHDGNLDVVSVAISGSTVQVRLGDGQGGFGAATQHACGSNARYPAIGDFNNDGDLDIAISRPSATFDWTDNLTLLFGNGAGGFSTPWDFGGTGHPTQRIAVDDFNGDGNADIAAASSEVRVILGLGNGAFNGPLGYLPGASPYYLLTGNLDQDARPDIVVTTSTGVVVMLNDGNGVFPTATPYTFTTGSTITATLGDVNADGALDIVAANETRHNIAVLLGDGGGGFAAPLLLAGGLWPRSVAIGDADADGNADIVVATKNSKLAVIRGDGSGGFDVAPVFHVGTGPTDVALADLNGDGTIDVVAGSETASAVRVFSNDGSGDLGRPALYGNTAGPRSVATGDLNGDLKPDVVTANEDSDSVGVLINGGSGNLLPAIDLPAGGQPYSVAIGDLNNDGKQDIVCSNLLSKTLSVYLGDGFGGFSAPTTVPIAAGFNGPGVITLGHFNADANLDLLVAGFGYTAVFQLLGNGAGGFGAPTSIPASSYPSGFAQADFNQDGRIDVAVSCAGIFNRMFVLFGTATGFAASVELSMEFGQTDVAAADVNGDGRMDIVALQANSCSVVVRLGDGAGGFGPSINFLAGADGLAIATADLNSDGRPDIVVANQDARVVRVLLNEGILGEPTTYCTAKVNSQGCTPQIASAGVPSASDALTFMITASNVLNNKAGILLYSTTPATTPFNGGTLCIGGSLKRTAIQASGGNAGPTDCSGTYSYDFNARIQSGIDPSLVPGVNVYSQYYHRDQDDPFFVGLTNGLTFTIAP